MVKIKRSTVATLKKTGAAIALVAVIFAFANFFIVRASMIHDDMANCPYMSHADSMCPMNSDNSIALWQTIFQAEPQNFAFNGLFLILIVLSLLLALRTVTWQICERLKLDLLRLYERGSPHIQLFNRIKQLFAHGLLNPKIFDSVSV